LFVSSIAAKSQSPASLQELQADFIGLRFGVMLHFNMGTFTNEEWAKPNQDTKLFNPTTLDCNQWAEACASAGMKYAILTTKHHDGFCLWDSKYTDYDVANSPYKKDVVRAYVDAFRKQGIAPCLYFSVWDKHNGVENGGLVEEEFILNQLTELLTQYGPIPMIIFDGWNWKMGHRKISYQRIYNHVKKLQPNCLVSEHNGNSNFQTDLIYYEGPKGVFPPGNNVFASQMALTMTDGWFWHESSPKNVKDEQYALDKLQRLEPLYCNFMLNIAPNRAGLFDQKVVETLHKIGQLWSPNSKRLPLPIQPLNMTSFLEPVGIVASAGWAFSQPALPANDGTPIAALLQEQTAQVMVDGCSDEISDNGGFSAFQTCWKFEKLTTSPQLTLDMGAVKEFSKLFYVPARWLGYEGVVTKFRISTSVDNKTFTVTHEGKWQKDTALKVSYFKPVAARYVRIELLESIGDPIVSEIGVGN
jgi:alpha-L-fucosidase